jgi:putative copper export protein
MKGIKRKRYILTAVTTQAPQQEHQAIQAYRRFQWCAASMFLLLLMPGYLLSTTTVLH